MDIYRPEDIARIQNLLDQMRKLIADKAGVTVVGNRVTVRWTPPRSKHLVDVHMVVVSVSTLEEAFIEEEKTERLDALRKRLTKKGIDIDAEMYYIESGQHPK